jgi:hypothetical protein
VNEIGWPALARCNDALGLNMSIKSAGRFNRDGVTEACGPSQVSPCQERQKYRHHSPATAEPITIASATQPKFRPRIWLFAMVSPT